MHIENVESLLDNLLEPTFISKLGNRRVQTILHSIFLLILFYLFLPISIVFTMHYVSCFSFPFCMK